VLAQASAAFGPRVQAGCAQATLAPKRPWGDRWLARVLVAHGAGASRAALPTHPRRATTRLGPWRKDDVHDIMHLLHLPDGDRRAVRCVIALAGGFLGVTAIQRVHLIR
jgi:hypothetical protein